MRGNIITSLRCCQGRINDGSSQGLTGPSRVPTQMKGVQTILG
jgi:hypothetical protein